MASTAFFFIHQLFVKGRSQTSRPCPVAAGSKSLRAKWAAFRGNPPARRPILQWPPTIRLHLLGRTVTRSDSCVPCPAPQLRFARRLPCPRAGRRTARDMVPPPAAPGIGRAGALGSRDLIFGAPASQPATRIEPAGPRTPACRARGGATHSNAGLQSHLIRSSDHQSDAHGRPDRQKPAQVGSWRPTVCECAGQN